MAKKKLPKLHPNPSFIANLAENHKDVTFPDNQNVVYRTAHGRLGSDMADAEAAGRRTST
ncbi:MAG: hypothetical protein Q8M19_19730 [Reyranella sp.]|nr:hypothetical protein [Reyranella sp.]